ncbi:GNAT family N-acetyltransferase [Phenylobacterium sp.]|uniref:GNAT family N-acetyltransferase n=1 Tax=Phenylobacterium sp. TaxID=1871053 RepID=UPI00289DE0F7|nr:GNAT family N-acetyltransferase [Phenylobacterium sp.]
MIIRRAQASEIAACAALYERVLRETFTWTPPQQHQAADFLGHAQEEEVYLARDGDRLLGIAGFHRPGNFLHSLYVETRGEGVGKALLDHVAALADGPLSLKCQSPNLRALDFYLREGFRIVDIGRDPGAPFTWLRMSR